MAEETRTTSVPFTLIYLTFFLDNVLLTVLVPMMPQWMSGAAVAQWATHESALARLLNGTVAHVLRDHRQGGSGWAEGSQAVVGLVLGGKAAAQLLTAPLAGAAVCGLGAAPVLRAATALLAVAALGLWGCSACSGGAAALCVGTARAAHGAGSALAGVAGLALAAAVLPARRAHSGIGALLGAVALGVLVGYPLGGATAALWSRDAPFLLIAVTLLVDYAMQYIFLNKEEYNLAPAGGQAPAPGACGVWRVLSAPGAVGACAGCVLLTTSALAVLEPCAPPWIARRFHAAQWQAGAVFVPDSLGYLLAAGAGGLAHRLGAERVAVAGQLIVGLSALAVPQASSVAALALPHFLLGLGLGAADAALVPALVARGGRGGARSAALLQTGGAAAYALGPAVGAALATATSFELTMRTLATLNLLYAAYLYTRLRAYPISEQWGAAISLDSDDDEQGEATSLQLAATMRPLDGSNITY